MRKPKKHLFRVLVKMTPDTLGFRDEGVLSDDTGFEEWRGPVRSGPNPYRPVPARTPWREYYGWIASGTYPISYYIRKDGSPSLLINRGLEVPARFPNLRQGGKKILTSLLVHSAVPGVNPDWPGSAGCLTIPKPFFKGFISCWGPGDTGTLIITDDPGLKI